MDFPDPWELAEMTGAPLTEDEAHHCQICSGYDERIGNELCPDSCPKKGPRPYCGLCKTETEYQGYSQQKEGPIYRCPKCGKIGLPLEVSS